MKKQKKWDKRIGNYKKKGYTLIEMIIAVAILAVLTSIISVGVYGYMLGSYMNRVNETARTIFLASQNYILEQKQLGKLDEFNKNAKEHGGDIKWDDLKNILKTNNSEFDETDYKEHYTTDTTAYVWYGPDSVDKENNPLYEIVKKYTQDTSLLKNTCLMEYDTETGVVRAVFYSEKTKTFTYTDGDEESKANVIKRDSATLKEKRQGYYGVDATGRIYSKMWVEAPKDVMLFNEERLYLQWTDNNAENPNFDMEPDLFEYLSYDVDVYRLEGVGDEEELLFSLADVEVDNKDFSVTMDEADDKPGNLPYRLAYDEGTKTYQLILDDIHHDIYEMYGTKKAGNENPKLTVTNELKYSDYLVCVVTAKLDSSSGYERAVSGVSSPSNEQSANYGGGEDKVTLVDGTTVNVGGSGDRENGSELGLPYSVSNARQFNHIRDGGTTQLDANYIQTADIDYQVPEVKKPDAELFFEPFVFSDNKAFIGNYTTKKNEKKEYFSVSNIVINQPTMQNVGLFSLNQGDIKGLTLVNPKVKGSYHVGTVAGVNGGNLTDVTVKNGNVVGSHVLGGVTGRNTAAGNMTNVQSNCKVEGTVVLTQDAVLTRATDIEIKKNTKGQYIGGIAGINQGSATDVKAEQNQLTGTAYLGGIFGANLSEKTLKSLTSYQTIQIDKTVVDADASKNIGGVIGYQSAEGNLHDSNNYGQFEFLDKAAEAKLERVENIGGIVGMNLGLVQNCLNEQPKATIDQTRNAYIDLVNKGGTPVYHGKNVGGIVGYNKGSKAEIKQSKNNGVVLGYSVVGGLVGKNEGFVLDNKDVEGLVIGANNIVGGIFGYHAGQEVKNFDNNADVFGNGVVGGIMGMNGYLGIDGENQILAKIANFGEVDSSEYYSKLLDIDTGFTGEIETAQIKKCNNTGYVFAKQYYGGGIVGLNYGTLDSCNVFQNTSITGLKADGADCVGGVAGYNIGKIAGDSSKLTTVVSMNGDDFVGGITGVNIGKISGYAQITGNVTAKGDCVGGIMGINTNPDAVNTFITNAGMTIEGAYFVGGIMGCNVAKNNTDKEIRIAQAIVDKAGKVKGEVYVGGIIGYNAYTDMNLNELYNTTGELKVVKENAYKDVEATGAPESNMPSTVFVNCTNWAQVEGNRYVGGIVGYNSLKAKLEIKDNFNGGTISISSNDKVEQSKDKAYYYYVGGITGRNSKAGIIKDSVNDGSVLSPSSYLGGICEVNEGLIQNCSIGRAPAIVGGDVTISGTYSVGGIVGVNRAGGKVLGCSMETYGVVSGGDKTGGLVGTNLADGFIGSDSTSKMSYVDGKVNGNGRNDIGGIVGVNEGTVEDVEVRDNANIVGGTNVGGFIGNNKIGASSSTPPVIKNLVNKGYVQGKSEVGGIIGKHSAANIENCTNAGVVWAIDKATTGVGGAGGITGSTEQNLVITSCVNYGTVISSFTNGGGIVGLNKGILKENCNYGSIEADKTSRELTSYIGGVVGHNSATGVVENCQSKDREDDPNKNNNPNAGTANKIRGNNVVGGLIGMQERQAKVTATADAIATDKVNEISIDIEPYKITTATDASAYIGGVVGKYGWGGEKPNLANFIYSGTISIPDKLGVQRQFVGGIIGDLDKDTTLENCLFKGKIEGGANDSQANDSPAGVGGLAGSASGTIIVYPMEEEEGKYTSNTVESEVSAGSFVGGIVGRAEESLKFKFKVGNDSKTLEEINKDKSSNFVFYENRAKVSGIKSVGGFVGVAEIPSFEYFKNMSPVTALKKTDKAPALNVGGIVGTYKGKTYAQTMNHCYNESDILSDGDEGTTQTVGGLVGSWTGTRNKVMKNCQNKGSITAGLIETGGLIGYMENGTIELTCKNVGAITITNKSLSARSIGGVAGRLKSVTIGKKSDSLQVMNEGKILILAQINAASVSFGGAGGIAGTTTQKVQMYNVKNEGAIEESALYTSSKAIEIGGILGSGSGEIEITNCENSGNIFVGASNVCGGIIGTAEKATSEFSMVNTTNKGAIKGNADIGGLIGLLRATDITITGNQNDGAVAGRERVGGVIGQIATVGTPSITNGNFGAKNTGTVSVYLDAKDSQKGVKHIGGCVGFIGASIRIKGLENEGAVQISNIDYPEISLITSIGGVVGEVGIPDKDNASTLVWTKAQPTIISNSKNIGDVKVSLTNEKTTKKIVRISGVGGIVGTLNTGDSIGGEDCADSGTINRGAITVDYIENNIAGIEGKADGVGGIVGIQHKPCVKNGSSTKIQYATNYGKITADKKSSENIGGIVGSSEGLVLSCKTEKGVEIKGYFNVGGLVGSAASYNSRITSIGTNVVSEPGFDLSYSEATVYGVGNVGGLVGRFKGATLYNVYTGEEALVVLKRGDARVTTDNAGGLIGYAEVQTEKNQSVVQGVVADCYSFATVKFEDDSKNYDSYIGGLVGYRNRIAEGSKKDWGAISVQECYVVNKDKVTKTKPPIPPMPSEHEIKDPKVDRGVWAIGNEPLVTSELNSAVTYMYYDKADQQKAVGTESKPLGTGTKHLWTEALCNAICDELGITSSGAYNAKASIIEIMQNYKGFTLPTPEMKQVESVERYRYKFPLEYMAGFYKKVNIALYKGHYDTVGQANGETPFKTLPIDILFGDEITNQEIDLKDALEDVQNEVGTEISVVVWAEGYKEENGELNYTIDSDKAVVQHFIIMPPVITPEIKRLLPEETNDYDPSGELMRVRFEVTNYAEYKKAAAIHYPTLNVVEKDKILDTTIYDSMDQGFEFVRIIDCFNSQAGIRPTGAYEEWKLYFPGKYPTTPGDTELELKEDGERAFFTIDYNKSKKYKEIGASSPYHTWRVDIKEVKGKTLTLDPKIPAFRYRYAPSDMMDDPYMTYQLTKRLPAPLTFSNTYTGGVDINTTKPEEKKMEYRLAWDAPPVIPGMKGYKIEISEIIYTDAKGKEQRVPVEPEFSPKVVESNASGNIILSQEDIDTIMGSLKLSGINYWASDQPEYRLYCTIETQSTDPTKFLPSVKKSTEVVLPKQEEQVTDIAAKKNKTNNLDISWEDDSSENEYQVKYTIISEGVEKQSATTQIGKGVKQYTDIGLDNTWSGKPFTVEVEIITLGKKGASLHSEIKKASIFTGKQLKTPTIKACSTVKVDKDPDTSEEFIYYKIDFEKNDAGVGDENISTTTCNGYRLIARVDETKYETELIIPNADSTTGEIPVLLTGHEGKNLTFYLEALGDGTTTSDSEKAFIKAKIASQRAEKPLLTSVLSGSTQIYKDNGVGLPPDITSISYLRDEYLKNLSIALEIRANPTGVSTAIKGQWLQLQIAGTNIHTGVTNIATTGKYDIGANIILLAHAGMDVFVKMNNLTNDVQIILPSEISVFTFTLPKIKLSEPKIDTIVETKEVVEDPDATPPVEKVEAYYTATYNATSILPADTKIEKEEQLVRQEQVIKLWDTVTDKAIKFYEVDETTGTNKKTDPIESLVIPESTYPNATDLRTIHFRIAEPESGTPAYDLTKVELRIQNKTKADEKKYDHSLETKQVLPVTPVTPPTPPTP